MIPHLDPPHALQPERQNHFQLLPAVEAGFIAGVILLVVPRGDPWSELTFFAPVVMGRAVPPDMGVPHGVTILVHLVLSVVYGLIVSRVVTSVTQMRSLIFGGVTGVVLYLLNLAIISIAFPRLHDHEFPVVFTHIVFGMIAAGAYRGLLRRQTVAPSISS